MAAKRLPVEWPALNIREFTDIGGAYETLKNMIREISNLRIRLVSVNNDHADRLTPASGSGAPGSTPSDVLLFYLDTASGDMYVSVGTASSADWKKITP